MSKLRKVVARWADGALIDLEAQLQFWKAACEEHDVRFSWPMTIETKRALVEKIMLVKEPELAQFSTVHLMGGEALTGLLQGLAKKHLLPKPGSKECGRPNESESRERLRMLALIFVEKNKTLGKHWGPDEKIKRILQDNPEFVPSQQRDSDNRPESAAYSQYRKDEKHIARLEEYRQKALPLEWQAFMDSLGTRGREWIVHISRLLHEIGPMCGDDLEARDVMIQNWTNLVAKVLPEPVLNEYLRLGMPEWERRIILGLHYQEEAEAARVDDETRKYYREAKQD